MPVRGSEVERIGDNVFGRTELGHDQRLVVAGHLDTVPPVGNEVPKVEGDIVWGVGASDMKGGLAVMLELATTVRAPTVDVTWCFYAREEIGRAESGLLELWQARPDLLAGDAAVLGEPTNALVEAGCQGTMRVARHPARACARTRRVPLPGATPSTAWRRCSSGSPTGRGANVVLDGCTYAEQLQVVGVEGGVAANVVPDEATVTLNHRYAPDRTAAEAGAFLRDLLEGTWEPATATPGRSSTPETAHRPLCDHPLLHALVAKSGGPPRAKVGWTDVASFWEHGVPAANFGPGDPLLAHHPDERVSAAQLQRAHDTLLRPSQLTPGDRASGRRSSPSCTGGCCRCSCTCPAWSAP